MEERHLGSEFFAVRSGENLSSAGRKVCRPGRKDVKNLAEYLSKAEVKRNGPGMSWGRWVGPVCAWIYHQDGRRGSWQIIKVSKV